MKQLLSLNILLTLLVSGCTAGSAQGPLFAMHDPVPAEQSVLYVYKPATAAQDGVTTCLTLVMNGQEQGCLRGQGYLRVTTDPGAYEVALVNKAGFGFKLLSFTLDLEPGSAKYLEYRFGASNPRALDRRYAGAGTVISGDHSIAPVAENIATKQLALLRESI